MANINVLDKSIFNRIAAGEVVEKPASVVKELVENSIDANAKNVTIEILGGGITKIKVTDDGDGMTKDNLPKAFLPHATSKITTLNDLEKIGTLGFRGEALSSISSVAKVTAISKTKDSDLGSKIEIFGGEVTSLTETGATNGTTIIVEDLFYCVPARAKFLRKPKLEESDITNIVSRLIMANPTVSIKYIVEDKIIFLSPGSNLLEAIYTIYGKTTTDNLLPLNYENDTFKISGFICKPTFSKPNRTCQTLIINGRYVINSAISAAMYKAYENYLMKNNFPFYVININIPLEKVDVNVHPNKLDVKFEDSGKVFGIILHAVSNVLLNSMYVKDLESISNDENEIILPANTSKYNHQTSYGSKSEDADNNLDNQIEKKRDQLAYFLTDTKKEFEARQDYGLSYELAKNAVVNNNIIDLKDSVDKSLDIENVSLFSSTAFKIIGVALNTYIIVEQQNDLYFIDQHAAHERILYDKFKNALNQKELAIQELLVPYILDVNYMESEFINNNLDSFKQLGFDIEHFGANTFKVSSVPVLFKNLSLNSFFSTVLKDITNTLAIQPFNIIKKNIARSACRTDVKSKDILSNN